jgi:hypothetical protein
VIEDGTFDFVLLIGPVIFSGSINSGIMMCFRNRRMDRGLSVLSYPLANPCFTRVMLRVKSSVFVHNGNCFVPCAGETPRTVFGHGLER